MCARACQSFYDSDTAPDPDTVNMNDNLVTAKYIACTNVTVNNAMGGQTTFTVVLASCLNCASAESFIL